MNERRDLMSRRARRSGILVAGLLALTGIAGQAALAASPNGPPGNNGTVKIHDGAGEPASETRNEPHVCTFHLHFFFADPEQSGTWEIQKWAPGPKGTVVLSGTYDTAGDGEDRQPEQGAYALPNGHYKLFWDGDLDTGKHDKMKVFWVDCEAAGTVAGTPTPAPTQQGQPAESESAAPTGDPVRRARRVGVDPPDRWHVRRDVRGTDLGIGGVLGLSVTPPPTDTGVVETTSQTSSWPLVLLVIGALVAVATFLTPARRRR